MIERWQKILNRNGKNMCIKDLKNYYKTGFHFYKKENYYFLNNNMLLIKRNVFFLQICLTSKINFKNFVGDMEIVGKQKAEGIKCHLKYIPYSYFSRDSQRRVKGVVMDASGDVKYVINGKIIYFICSFLVFTKKKYSKFLFLRNLG